MTTQPNAFERRFLAEFGEPFDSIEGVAAYLIHPDNDSPAYAAIRNAVLGQVGRPLVCFEVALIEMVTKLPESRALMVDCATSTDRYKLALNILLEALAQVQGDGGDDDVEESGR